MGNSGIAGGGSVGSGITVSTVSAGGLSTFSVAVYSGVCCSLSFLSCSRLKMARTFFSRDARYFRSPGFPWRRVPNSPGWVFAVPLREKGCCPYSWARSSLDTEIGGSGESLPVRIFQKLTPGGNVSGKIDRSTGSAEDEDAAEADGCACSAAGAELSAGVSTLTFLASLSLLPEVASRTGFATFFE